PGTTAARARRRPRRGRRPARPGSVRPQDLRRQHACAGGLRWSRATLADRLGAPGSPGSSGHVDQRAGELELAGELAPALQGEIESCQADNRLVELVLAEVPGLLVQLLHVVAVSLQALGRGSRRDTLRVEPSAVADASHVRRYETRHA